MEAPVNCVGRSSSNGIVVDSDTVTPGMHKAAVRKEPTVQCRWTIRRGWRCSELGQSKHRANGNGFRAIYRWTRRLKRALEDESSRDLEDESSRPLPRLGYSLHEIHASNILGTLMAPLRTRATK
ncbi:uncharacterized protein LOC143022790 [Oratosquilla oratoria]|uniref:uncharacterized protein LOC143022790 n=1 Tax=Oratosquilla oratoria TaxID=337810 RepID=UPI003F769A7C